MRFSYYAFRIIGNFRPQLNHVGEKGTGKYCYDYFLSLARRLDPMG